jgi:hypothetical protein
LNDAFDGGEMSFRKELPFDQLIGSYMDVIHRWKDEAFNKDTPTKSKEAGAAGV